MVLLKGVKSFFRRRKRFFFGLGFVFIGFHAKRVGGFIPQKIRFDTRRAFFRAWYTHQLRLRLFIGGQIRHGSFQTTFFIQHQNPADFLLAKAIRRHFRVTHFIVFCCQTAVIAGKGGKNHAFTSSA